MKTLHKPFVTYEPTQRIHKYIFIKYSDRKIDFDFSCDIFSKRKNFCTRKCEKFDIINVTPQENGSPLSYFLPSIQVNIPSHYSWKNICMWKKSANLKVYKNGTIFP